LCLASGPKKISQSDAAQQKTKPQIFRNNYLDSSGGVARVGRNALRIDIGKKPKQLLQISPKGTKVAQSPPQASSTFPQQTRQYALPYTGGLRIPYYG